MYPIALQYNQHNNLFSFFRMIIQQLHQIHAVTVDNTLREKFSTSAYMFVNLHSLAFFKTDKRKEALDMDERSVIYFNLLTTLIAEHELQIITLLGWLYIAQGMKSNFRDSFLEP
jgi:hypothetical protein